MEEQIRTRRIRQWMFAAVIIALAAIIVGIFLFIIKRKTHELQQNIYFMEWDSGEEETIFYKYDYKDDEVVRIGIIEGKFRQCVINGNETCITASRYNGEFQERIQLDLTTGMVQIEDIGDRVNPIIENDVWNAMLLYDEGNKMLISYKDKEGDEKWMFYDFLTEEYDIIEGIKNTTGRFLKINDDELWYASGNGDLYQYNWKTNTSTKVLDSINCAAVAPKVGLITYVEKGMQNEKIYLYNLNRKKVKCIIHGGWNTYYGDFFDKKGQWSNDGRYFFYTKSFPGLFSASNIRMMYN